MKASQALGWGIKRREEKVQLERRRGAKGEGERGEKRSDESTKQRCHLRRLEEEEGGKKKIKGEMGLKKRDRYPSFQQEITQKPSFLLSLPSF